jgi:muconolactone D-isomerase
MQLLVHLTVRIPHDVPAEVVAELRAAEKARALELQRDGRWRHLWRVVGREESYSVFEVDDLDELHQLLVDLPLFRYLDIEVTPLATHPSLLAAPR